MKSRFPFTFYQYTYPPLLVDIEKMFTSAHLYAELGNRAKPNIHDITRSLEDAGIQLETFQDYLKAKVNDSETCKCCLYTTYNILYSIELCIVHKTNRFFKTSKSNITTLEDTPEFLPSENEDSDEDDEENEDSLTTYVPRHLPHFPSKHSFRQTPVSVEFFFLDIKRDKDLQCVSLDIYPTSRRSTKSKRTQL